MALQARRPGGLQQPDSLMHTLQSEVADEASPMLLFLSRHARSIALGVLLFIVGIVGYWIYSGQMEAKRKEDVLGYGQLLLISDPKTRLEKLETFVNGAPDAVRRAAWFSIMEAAHQLKDYDKLYTAWEKIRGFDDSFAVTATVAMADARSSQGKYEDALRLLEGVAASAKPAEVSLVNSRIVFLAESLKNYSRAILACDAMIGKVGGETDTQMWSQKKMELEQKAAASQ